MKKLVILMAANLKKQKGTAAGIFLLILLISISVSSVICIWYNSGTYVSDEMDRVGFGEIAYWLQPIENDDEFLKEVNATDGVEQSLLEEIVGFRVKISGNESGTVYAHEYEGMNLCYKIFDGMQATYRKDVEELLPGEIYVPISYQSIFDAKIGDTVTILEHDIRYTIKGFYENPSTGSSSMGIKDILMNSDDFEDLRQKSIQADETLYPVSCLHIRVDDMHASSVRQVQKNLGRLQSIQKYMIFSYTKSSFAGFMLMTQNIFGAILLAFSIILLIVAMIVIGHTISSTIEQNYVDLGILKALGYTKGNLCFVQCGQYLILLFTGAIIGIAVSGSLISAVNQITLPVTGILIPDELPVALIAVVFTILLALLTFYTFVKSSRVEHVSPMTAIRGGKKEVHFDSRIKVGIYAKALQFFLALRQLVSGKKRYLGAGMIAALLVFFLTFCMRLYGWLGEDGDGLKNSMGVASVNGRTYDFSITYQDQSVQDEAEARIEEYCDITAHYQSFAGAHNTIQMEGISFPVCVLSRPDYLHVIKGRYCKYQNEMAVTTVVAEEMGIAIGDTVTVAYGDVCKEYIITGFYQCANDMGNNVAMSMEGFENIYPDEAFYADNYQLSAPQKKKEIVDMLKTTYQDKIVIEDNEWSGIDGIVKAAGAIQVLTYGISAIFIVIVVYMTGSKILYREQHDLGIYQSLGFSSLSLRISFAMRFGLVSVAGSFLGILLGIILTDPIAGKAFSIMGISNFKSQINLSGMMFSFVFVVSIFVLFAYVLSGKMKKTGPVILITE